MDNLRSDRRKKQRWKKRILFIFLLLLLLLIGYGIYVLVHALNAANDSYEGLDREGDKSDRRDEAVTIGDDPISILLMGIEDYSSGGENGRADTQIVVTLNPESNKMTMTSINRDTRVELSNVEPYNGFHKINAAYTYASLTGYGANKLAVETVEDLLDIPIDKYITVNFESFRDIVNVLGGVTIDVKEGFWEENIYDNNNRIYFDAGEQKLNGEEALAFVRMRKRAVNDVYPREERQRQFIRAAIDQAISAETIFKVGQITDIIGDNVETNLKATEIYALERAYSSMDTETIETIEIEGDDDIIDGSYYFLPDESSLQEVSERLKQELGLIETEEAVE